MEKPQIYTNEKNNKAVFFAQQNIEREREREIKDPMRKLSTIFTPTILIM